jgi:hypothetical protein
MLRLSAGFRAFAAVAATAIIALSLTVGRASSREDDTTWLYFQVTTSPEISLREEYINQQILKYLLLYAERLPDVSPCRLSLPIALDFNFGHFAVVAHHLNPARRISCLRGVVRYMLREGIAEADFGAVRDEMTNSTREWSEPDPQKLERAAEAAKRLAFLEIYRKFSPRYQLHSIDASLISDLSFDDFSLWLERDRKASRFTFFAKDALLQALDLPIPDRMVLQPVTSLTSPRTPSGVMSFDGERFKVPGFITIYLGRDDPAVVDQKIMKRFGCRYDDLPPGPDDRYAAIERVRCSLQDHFGELWFGLLLWKPDGVSYQEFCRQAQELALDPDIAAVARFSPDGSKGKYVLLPPACKAPD